MRFAALATALGVLASTAMAVAPLKSVIVSYPNDAPWSVVDDAVAAIENMGGEIKHRYNIIKGFAANAPPAALEQVQALSKDKAYAAVIENDGVVTTNGE